jgi:4-hydroxyacetophenone monooxygenase
VITRGGARHRADILVLATGFEAARMTWPIEVRGRRGATLQDRWGDDDPRAYLGITVPDFPNFFLMYGPNTNLAHGGSAIFHSECQTRYALLALRELLEGGHRALDCRPEVHDRFNEQVDRKHAGMVWAHRGVGSWYKNRRGRVFATSPWRLIDYWNMTRHFDPADYRID